MPHQGDLDRRVSPQRRASVPLATVCVSINDLPGMRLLSLSEKRPQGPFRTEPDPEVGFAMVALRVLEGVLEVAFKRNGEPTTVKLDAGSVLLFEDRAMSSMRSAETPLRYRWYEFLADDKTILPMRQVLRVPYVQREDDDYVFMRRMLLQTQPWKARQATLRFLRQLCTWLGDIDEPTDPFEAVVMRMAEIDGTNPNIADLAVEYGLTMPQLRRCFKRRTGLTPKQYQTRIRGQLAIELLLRGDSIQEAASKLGYFDTFHFSQAFYKLLHIRPNEFVDMVEKAGRGDRQPGERTHFEGP